MSDRSSEDAVAWFCRQVRARSGEHSACMPVAVEERWASIAVGILRQELDSMIRVIFLLQQEDPHVRRRLLEQSVSGEKWKVLTPNGKMRSVRDSDMVDLAERLHGWTRRVYDFGCAFVHLSDRHDHQARDPFRGLASEEREQIAGYLRYYHGGEVSADSEFSEIIEYLPGVLEKISSNLGSYLRQLEASMT